MTNPVPKSCHSCPSFLLPTQAVSKFKRSIGAPMCGRYGHVLGKPGLKAAQEAKLQEHFASKCDAYGQPMPPLPVDIKLQVVMPDLDARTATLTPAQQSPVNSCAICKNFVREDAVVGELGWTAGLCAAKGKLILSNRQVAEAKNCEFRSFGKVRETTGGLHLLPEYEEAFATSGDPVRAFFKSRKEGIVDPTEYPSDKEVSPDEEESGIRAWRKVVDPDDSGSEVYLPIYRGDFFTPEEQSKIPKTGEDAHPELYVDHFGGVYGCAVAWMELDETPTLWGQAGTGKTELFRHLAWLMQIPFERVSVTASTELDDVAGKMRYTPDIGTYFQYGRLPKAWIKPCVLCIDEPNVGPVDVWQFLRPMTDNAKQLVLDMNDGEHLDRHSDCYLGLAMNPAWDAKNVGALEISDADANRLFHTFVELPPLALEREIIQERVKLDGWELSSDQLNMVMVIAGEIRDLAKDGTLQISWGIRPQIKVARALKWFAPVAAYRRGVADFLDEEPREIILDVVRAHIKE